MNGFREITLTDSEWGTILLLVATPKPDAPWGVLEPLRGTKWGEHVQEVSGMALSHALHGWATPLMREIGPDPKVRARRVPDDIGRCALTQGCVGASPTCRPGPDSPPGCYEPSGVPTPDASAVTTMVMAWKEGRYVLVVKGAEFSF